MNFDIGVSDPFSDIYGAQLYYLQACAALENGRLFEPQEHFYLFQNYALTELIINALGKLPVEMYFTDGLRRLARHDLSSAVSYIQTLRAYLENNMSISKTARKLFINRSTLIERISRIKRDLNTDLSDPDERLRFLILLKALDIQNKLQMKPEQ
jgi:DNA-binding PucR family transcriptional regulator